MANESDLGQGNAESIDQLRKQLLSEDPKTRIEAAFALAEEGIFDGVDELIQSLRHSYWSVRSKAAYCLGRIGIPNAILPLAELAKTDPEPETRNDCIYALEGIGRMDCIPHLIDCLDDDEASRREDARTVLVRILGESVLEVLADDMDWYNEETDEVGKDPEEVSRVRAWFQTVSNQFQSNKVYHMGLLADPGIFIAHIRANIKYPMDAVFRTLEDWTGESFESKSMKKAVEQWEAWWRDHEDQYESGERYFYGHQIK